VIYIYDEAGNVGSKTPEHAGDFKEPGASETKNRHAVKRDGSL
jgi:hypothetical protein